LCLILALEREVVDTEVAVCYRLFAWWHLLAVWASLRFDDHRGLPPSSVQLTPRGLEAVLCRTKTTGPGKRIASLPLIVGFGSYLRQRRWLETGWRLWQEAAPFVRDYFLVKPATDLNSTLPVELSYEQASRVSRAVLAGLPREDDVMPSLAEPVIGLFTQHSARCWLASMAALQEVPDADVAYLGRWSPTTSRGYVRTATEVVLRVQETVARRTRRDFEYKIEGFAGEQSAYLDLRRELLRRSFSEALINEQFDAMEAWTIQLASAPVEEGPALDLPEPADGVLADAGLEGIVEPLEGQKAGADAPVAPPTPPLVSEENEDPAPQLPVSEASEGPPTSGYVVSLSRTDWRKLHRFGGCPRMPGVHYLRFELLGDARPGPEAYDDFCRQCWKLGGPDEDTDAEESETEPEEDEAPILVDDPGGPGAAAFAQHS